MAITSKIDISNALAGLSDFKKSTARGVLQRALNKAAGPIVALKNYFGSFAQFPLAKPIRVEKGDQLALTIPTWAPSLQVGLAGDTSWRAARDDKKCKDFKTQTAQMNVGDKGRYLCLYRTARLAYSATLVTFPKQVNKPKAKKSIRDSR